MAAADPKLQALLELERRGALTPEATQLLKGYRAQGVTKTKPLSPTGEPVVESGDMLETASKRDSARKAMSLINRVQPQLDRVSSLYGSQLKGSGPIKSIREWLPSPGNSQFDKSVAQLAALTRPVTRTEGEGAMSDFESKLALQLLPGRYSFDSSNEEAIRGLQELLDTARSDYSKQLGLPAPPPRAKSKPKPTNDWSIQEIK